MRGKKTESEAPEVAQAEPQAESQELSALGARIKELEAKIAGGEEAALKRVCLALNVRPEEVSAREAANPRAGMRVRCFVHFPVRINMHVYQGDVTVPYDVFQVIQQALGDRRMRLLSELTGNNYILKELAGGGFAPQLVGKINDAGEKIA